MDPERLLDGLDPSQRRAVTSPAQPLAILAGAGSGKTRVLTRRIAHRCLTGSADARHVLALTFTRKAAGELDARLRAFGLRDLPAAGTFHSVAYAQLRTRWASAGDAAPTLLDGKGRILGRVLGSTTRASVADLAAEIEWARARCVEPDDYEREVARTDRRTPVEPGRIAEWYRRYEQEKRRRGVVDFDDLLARCADAIERDPAFAAAQRWRFRHLFVDEYQDLNRLQDRLLRAWLGDRVDLAVVGDPNQAIYGWNGADPSLLTDIERHHPGTEVIALEDSYRSTPQILATAGALLGDRPGSAAALRAHRPDGPIPTVVGYATDRDEANGIARAAHDHHGPGRGWSSQAVLVRTNAQISIIEEAFRRAAIPHRVRGAGDLLADADVAALLRELRNRDEPLTTSLADLQAVVDRDRAELVGTDGEGDEPTETSALGRRVAALEQVVRLGHDLLVVEPTARARDLGGWLRATLRDEGSERGDAVDIVSFHAAKGLEWSVVHVAGLEAGYVPITHARTAEARAEEQRLLYVALTRAADVLRCTWAGVRTFGEREVERRPSPLLGPLRATLAELATAETDAPDPRGALADSRAALEPTAAPAAPPDAPAVDDAVRRALQRWRDGEARKVAAAPTVVLSDKALEALVRVRPATADELASLADVGPATRERHGTRLLAIVAEPASA